MFVLYSFIVLILLVVLSYPYLKNYQLCGYDLCKFIRDLDFVFFKLDDKNSLVLTKRMTRFLVVYSVLLLAILIPIFYFISVFWLIFVDCLVLAVVLPLFVMLAHLLISPVENLIKKFYLRKTKQRLRNFKGTKIAIVGSFGKTSLKNILYEILNDKFKTIITPKNFNTPMGISKTVLSELKEDTQIAIFEMGARREGEIEELVKLVDPDLGVMTAVGEQHLETFKNIETVKRTKNELVKFISNSARIVFNGASQNTKELYLKCKKKKLLACDQNGFSKLKNIAYSRFGSSFDMEIDGKKRKVQTKLLGEFNCQNIVLASTVAYTLGVDLDYICERIKNINPIKNRLQIIDNNHFTVIDDSYNANPVGCEEALNVLKLFEGEKIVVTSGMVELGDLQYEKNFVLGKQIGGSADKVLVMNEVNKKAILQGLKALNFDESKVYFATSRETQKEVLKQIVSKNCVVLFQNDLPDNYR